MKRFLFLLIVLGFCLGHSQNSWFPLGPNDFIGDSPFTPKTANLVTLKDKNNVIYILHQENYTNKLTVKKFANGNWVNVGNSIGYVRNDACALAIDNNNIIYVAYSSDSNGGFLQVKKFENNTWVSLPTVDTKSVFDISLDINSEGLPVVVYKNVNVTPSPFYISQYNGTKWAGAPINSLIIGIASNPVLKIDRSVVPNVLYLAYIKGANAVSVLKNSSGSWESVGGTLGASTSVSLEIINNDLYTSFINFVDDIYKIKVKKYTSNNWFDVGNLDFASSNKPISSSLKIKNNVPYLIFGRGEYEAGKASLLNYDGTNWNFISENQNVSADFFGYPGLVFINDVPIVVYSGVNGSFAKYYGTKNSLSTIDIENLSNKETNIYPNPVSNKFKITTKENILNIRILDITGKELQNIETNFDDEIDISNLTTGIYILNIYSNKGIISKKIIKK